MPLGFAAEKFAAVPATIAATVGLEGGSGGEEDDDDD